MTVAGRRPSDRSALALFLAKQNATHFGNAKAYFGLNMLLIGGRSGLGSNPGLLAHSLHSAKHGKLAISRSTRGGGAKKKKSSMSNRRYPGR